MIATFGSLTLYNLCNPDSVCVSFSLSLFPLCPGEGVNGEPTEENFGTEECEMPSPDSLAPGQVLVKNLFLSVDPALVCLEATWIIVTLTATTWIVMHTIFKI